MPEMSEEALQRIEDWYLNFRREEGRTFRQVCSQFGSATDPHLPEALYVNLNYSAQKLQGMMRRAYTKGMDEGHLNAHRKQQSQTPGATQTEQERRDFVAGMLEAWLRENGSDVGAPMLSTWLLERILDKQDIINDLERQVQALRDDLDRIERDTCVGPERDML